MTVLTLSASFFVSLVNLGLLIGAVMAVLLLLRPVTVRLLTPGQRVALWGVAWVLGALPTVYGLCSQINLPFPTFPDLLVSRAEGIYPGFLPDIKEAGRCYLALPGDRAVPLELSQGAIALMGVLGILYLIGILAGATRIDIRVRRLARSGVLLDGDQYDSLGLAREEKVIVRLCEHLPTSFVIRTGKGHEIALQRELSREQMRLVLLHEREHVRRRDPWLQGLISTGLWLYFWNPILWAAYYFTRRDMELACDRRVLRILREEERREYAHTLVELASGRPVFGGITTFGECDAALRVKEVTRWEPEDESDDCGPRRIIGWMVVIALSVFLVLGGPRDKALTEEVLWNLGQVDAWTVLERELAEEGAAVSPDTSVWLEGERHFAFLCFQDSAGNWWKAMVRRYLYHGEVEAHLSAWRGRPELEGYVPVTWGQTG